MAKVLDRAAGIELVGVISDAISDLGYEPEEVIPALVCIIGDLALLTENPNQALDEVVAQLDKQAGL